MNRRMRIPGKKRTRMRQRDAAYVRGCNQSLEKIIIFSISLAIETCSNWDIDITIVFVYFVIDHGIITWQAFLTCVLY